MIFQIISGHVRRSKGGTRLVSEERFCGSSREQKGRSGNAAEHNIDRHHHVSPRTNEQGQKSGVTWATLPNTNSGAIATLAQTQKAKRPKQGAMGGHVGESHSGRHHDISPKTKWHGQSQGPHGEMLQNTQTAAITALTNTTTVTVTT